MAHWVIVNEGAVRVVLAGKPLLLVDKLKDVPDDPFRSGPIRAGETFHASFILQPSLYVAGRKIQSDRQRLDFDQFRQLWPSAAGFLSGMIDEARKQRSRDVQKQAEADAPVTG